MDSTDKYFWNEVYYPNLKKSEKDFLKETYLSRFISELPELLTTISSKTALDLGCGLGQDTQWLLSQGFDVTACDISQKATQQLKGVVPDKNLLHFDMAKGLPFRDDTFGLVNANLSLHYFDFATTEKLFADIERVLIPGGILIGRVNSDKNNYIDADWQEIEADFYYNQKLQQHKRLFNQQQFDHLTKNWEVVILRENLTVRKQRQKFTWEFVLRKPLA